MRLPYCRAKPAWRSATAQTARADRDRQQPEAGAEQNHRARFRRVERRQFSPEIRTLAEAEDHVADHPIRRVGGGSGVDRRSIKGRKSIPDDIRDTAADN